MHIALLIGGPGNGMLIDVGVITPILDYPIIEPLTLLEHFDEIAAGKPYKVKVARYSIYDDCPLKYIYEEES